MASDPSRKDADRRALHLAAFIWPLLNSAAAPVRIDMGFSDGWRLCWVAERGILSVTHNDRVVLAGGLNAIERVTALVRVRKAAASEPIEPFCMKSQWCSLESGHEGECMRMDPGGPVPLHAAERSDDLPERDPTGWAESSAEPEDCPASYYQVGAGSMQCELPAGHPGAHRHGDSSWQNLEDPEKDS